MKVRGIRKKHVAIAAGSAAVFVGALLVYISMNTQFDLMMPDNASMHGVILSSDNFSMLKQNIGVFTVYQQYVTTQNATIGYCPIAEFIHEHEDGYDDTHVGNSTIYNATLPPAWCGPELTPVSTPEFFLAMPIFATGIGIIMLLGLLVADR